MIWQYKLFYQLDFFVLANSFIHLVKYLFSVPEVKENNLSSCTRTSVKTLDPLEVFFECQRQRGGTSDNPNVCEFLKNTLRVADSFQLSWASYRELS